MYIPKIGSRLQLVGHFQHFPGAIYKIIPFSEYVKTNPRIKPDFTHSTMYYECPCVCASSMKMSEKSNHDKLWENAVCEKHIVTG